MRWALALVVSTLLPACVADVAGFGSEPPEPPEPVANDPSGVVREPEQGAVIVGDPSTVALHVAGVYSEPDQDLSIQVLANSNDLESWVTIGTARTAATASGGTYAFATNVRPVASAAESARWPRGGVLRLRVVDDSERALPWDPSAPDDSVIAVVNPADVPASWTYLMEKAPGSIAETLEYYAAIDAPTTLDAFMTRYGFPGGETNAVYYNAGDLGIGREMHCRATQTPAGGLACYVRNFGIFGGDESEALALTVAGGIPLATVAMVYTPPITAPNAVTFMVYGPNGELINEAQLDTFGNNTSIPQNCLNCHGGNSRYDAATNAVTGARFLPFDPAAFTYGVRADLTLIAQEQKFRLLNRLVDQAAPTTGVRELINGIFPPNGGYDPSFVPQGWRNTAADARVYREVIAPYCRSCHVSFDGAAGDELVFATADSVRTRAAPLMQHLCGAGPLGMPAAEQTTRAFFSSPARAVILQWLGEPGACAPAP
jgi:hypothetical protein